MPYSAGLATGVPSQAGYFDAGSGQNGYTQRYLLIFNQQVIPNLIYGEEMVPVRCKARPMQAGAELYRIVQAIQVVVNMDPVLGVYFGVYETQR